MSNSRTFSVRSTPDMVLMVPASSRPASGELSPAAAPLAEPLRCGAPLAPLWDLPTGLDSMTGGLLVEERPDFFRAALGGATLVTALLAFNLAIVINPCRLATQGAFHSYNKSPRSQSLAEKTSNQPRLRQDNCKCLNQGNKRN